MVWPSRTRSGDFPGVLASYAGAAEAVDGIFLPADQAWREAWQLDPDLALYGPDGFHPSLLGTWLAALVIFSRLYDAAPEPVPTELEVDGSTLRISDETAAVLRAAAARALEAWP